MTASTRLPNGVSIISRRLPGRRSAALGLWLLNGARHESAVEGGYAHLLEHLLFKGAAQFDAAALASRLEELGGQVNAHTGRELTALHGLVPKADAHGLLRILIDMLLHPRFGDDDVAAERRVILQEMAMVEDGGEALDDRAIACAFPDHPLGRSVLGRPETIARTDAAALREYLRRQLSGGRLWVVAAGDVNHDALVSACAELAALPPGALPAQAPARFVSGERRIARSGGRSQLVWLLPIPPADSVAYPACLLGNHIVGGGVSSRLHQALRERRALVYGIHSQLEFYSDCGIWMIQTACDPRDADDCRAAVADTVARLLRDGIDPRELETARRHLIAHLEIDEDSPGRLMDRLAHEAIYLGQHPELDKHMRRLNEVDGAAIVSVLAQAWDARLFVRAG